MAMDQKSRSGWRLAIRKTMPTATTINPPAIEGRWRYARLAMRGSLPYGTQGRVKSYREFQITILELRGTEHSRFGIAGEACLERPGKRVGETREGGGPGQGIDVVPNVSGVGIEFDGEALFAHLGMAG